MIQEFLAAVVQWAAAQSDVSAVILVGSHARGAATASSDVDLLLLTSCPEKYLQDTGWARKFGNVGQEQVENWGKVTSLRVWYSNGQEVEYGLTTPEWAAPPMDEGTRRVVADGIKVLFDRQEITSLLQQGSLPQPC